MQYTPQNWAPIEWTNIINNEKEYGNILIISAVKLFPSVFEKIEKEEENKDDNLEF